MKFFVATASLVFLAAEVNAHGYLSQPEAYFPNGIDTSYNALLTASCDPAFSGLKWDDSPEKNTATFTSSFPNSQFKTLRDLMDTAAPDCGKTSLTGSPVDVSSFSSMKWQNDQEQKGFIDSHRGPCEAWIDDKRVFQSDDCRGDFSAYPAEIPIDYSSCSGDCTFTFYWLALHEPNWQVYKQCAPITNGSGGGQTTQTDAPESPTADASTTQEETDAPSVTQSTATDAPASEYDDTPAPVTTPPTVETTAPTTATTAPSVGTVAPDNTPTTNCKTRRRRRLTANLRSEN